MTQYTAYTGADQGYFLATIYAAIIDVQLFRKSSFVKGSLEGLDQGLDVFLKEKLAVTEHPAGIVQKRNKLGLAYSLDTFSEPGVETGYIVSYVATDSENLDRALQALKKELRNIKEGTIDDSEIDSSKSELIGAHTMSLQSFKNLAYRMALDEIYGLGYDFYKKYESTISGISKEDIVKAAGRYFDLDNVATVTVTNSPDE